MLTPKNDNPFLRYEVFNPYSFLYSLLFIYL